MLPASTKICITYYQEPRPCQKMECALCLSGKKHLPYWFATALVEGLERHLYLGSEFRPITLKDLKSESISQAQISFQKSVPSIANSPLDHASWTKDDMLMILRAGANIAPASEVRPANAQRTKPQIEVIRRQQPAPSPKTQSSENSVRPELPTEKEFQQDLYRFKMARQRDMKQLYRHLIKKYHPDQFHADDPLPEIQEWMKLINVVYEAHLRRSQRAYMR